MYLLSPVSLCFLCVTSSKKNQVIFFPQDTVQFPVLGTTVRNSTSFKSGLKETIFKHLYQHHPAYMPVSSASV